MPSAKHWEVTALLLRPSGTEPLIRVMVKQKSMKIRKYTDEVIKVMEKEGFNIGDKNQE